MTRPTHFSYPVIPDRLSMDRHRSAARGVYLSWICAGSDQVQNCRGGF
jgi:hypothetical protein